MTSSRGIAFAAALLLGACTQAGDTGPQGPKGDAGAQGLQGIQGIQGPPGSAAPRLVVKTSTGEVLGPAQIAAVGYADYLVAHASPPCVFQVNLISGQVMYAANVYFDAAGCSGSAFLDIGPTNAILAHGSTRMFTPAWPSARASRAFVSTLRWDATTPGCFEESGVVDAYPAVELPLASPFPAPLTLAFE